MTNVRKISSNSYNFSYKYFINGLKIKVFSSKLTMGYLYHAIILLLVLFKRLQPIKTNNKTDVNTQTF